MQIFPPAPLGLRDCRALGAAGARHYGLSEGTRSPGLWADLSPWDEAEGTTTAKHPCLTKSDRTTMDKALSGVRILDFSHLLQGRSPPNCSPTWAPT